MFICPVQMSGIDGLVGEVEEGGDEVVDHVLAGGEGGGILGGGGFRPLDGDGAEADISAM